MIDFTIPPELETARQSVAAFMDQHVYPNENQIVEDEGIPVELESKLQEQVKAQGLWAPHLPKEWGGMEIGFIGQALVNEIVGRSVIGPRIFGNAAPDAGNAELLLVDESGNRLPRGFEFRGDCEIDHYCSFGALESAGQRRECAIQTVRWPEDCSCNRFC